MKANRGRIITVLFSFSFRKNSIHQYFFSLRLFQINATIPLKSRGIKNFYLENLVN